jgi:uncharacterized membrane protein
MTIIVLFLVVVALVFYLFPPKRINRLYGYRTFRSMKNEDNWRIANKSSSQIMLVSVTILLLISLLFDYFDYENDTLLLGMLLIAFFALFYYTENKIK